MTTKALDSLDAIAFRLLVSCAAVFATVAVNPFTGLDPINLPKMLVLASFSFALVPLIVIDFRWIKSVNQVAIFLILIFLLALLSIPFLSDTNLQSQFWGAFGRSTGILTYMSYIFLFVAVAIWTSIDRNATFHLLRLFERTTYFVSFYTVIQYADLDPINWSQRLPFATLGNINFMSAFLGLANCLFISRLMFQKCLIGTQMFYVIMILINSLLIWFTGSIQGLAIVLVTTLASLVVLSLSKKRYLLASFQILSSAVLGVFAALGSVAKGPLSALLYQETVVFRLDYWKAGIAMFVQNPFNGVGIDNYGERYREFRDYAATVRTGPARISNTAHNVFIDLLSGGGIFVGGTFLGLVLLAVVASARKSVKQLHESSYSLLFPLNLGFLVFCLISIGQIGVVVWGIVFCAASLGNTENFAKDLDTSSKRIRSAAKDPRVVKTSVEYGLELGIFKGKTLRWLKPFALLSGFAMGLFLAFIPNKADSDFLAAYRSQDASRIEVATLQLGATDFHHEKFLQFLIDRSDFDSAFKQALVTKERFPRNFFANSSLLYLPDVPSEDKVAAAKALLILDPNNDQLISDAQKTLFNN